MRADQSIGALVLLFKSLGTQTFDLKPTRTKFESDPRDQWQRSVINKAKSKKNTRVQMVDRYGEKMNGDRWIEEKRLISVIGLGE